MADLLEVWFTPTGGMAGERQLLMRRRLEAGERPPVTYMLDEGGPVLIASGPAERRRCADGWVWRVEVVDPNYEESREHPR